MSRTVDNSPKARTKHNAHTSRSSSCSDSSVRSRKRSLLDANGSAALAREASEDGSTEPSPKKRRSKTFAHQPTVQELTGLDAYRRLSPKILGEGSYGKVFLGKDKRTSELVALKRVTIHEKDLKTGFPITSVREIKIVQKLQHVNIVRLHEVVCGGALNHTYLVFEYYEHDLADLTDTQGARFTVSEIKCIILQVLGAVHHAHQHFVIHRDIKLSNILMNNRGNVVLCDWGLARMHSWPMRKLTAKVVTLPYRAPELLFGVREYHTAIDMWAIGCTLAELLLGLGKPLLYGKNEMEMVMLIYKLLGAPNHHIWPNYQSLPAIVQGTFEEVDNDKVKSKCKFNEIDSLFGKYRAHCLDLIKKLLAYDPSKRITAGDAITHPFFKEMPLPCSKDMMPTYPAKLSEKDMKK